MLVGQLPSTDLSTATITSDGYDVSQASGFSISIAVTGSPVGVFKLQGSNSDTGTTTYDDISGATYSTTTAVNFSWNVSDVFYSFVRLIWTKTSGTGTITDFYITTKG